MDGNGRWAKLRGLARIRGHRAGSKAVRAAVKTCSALWGKEPVVGKWTFSTNGVAICGTHGIPCIGFGPGDEALAHAPNERIEANQLEAASAFYALVPYMLEED